MTNPANSPKNPDSQPHREPLTGDRPTASSNPGMPDGLDGNTDLPAAPARIPASEQDLASPQDPAAGKTRNVPAKQEGKSAPKGDAKNSGKAAGKKRQHQNVKGSVAGSTWLALIIGALILILLLVFILQNQTEVQLIFFGWEWNFPIGVGMLIAAIAGALIMAMVGIVRMAQLRRQIKRGYK